MKSSGNPFDSLYVTEEIDPRGFVEVFSPTLVEETSTLYQPGNVILMGTQGSGKSMLLTLLKSATRLAYEQQGEPFPPDRIADPFIGFGINLIRSGAIDFGQRPVTEDSPPQFLEAAFADFLNYWLVSDLMDSVALLANSSSTRPWFRGQKADLDRFARDLAAADCWFGAHSGVTDFQQLRHSLNERISIYRQFFNYNIEAVPDRVLQTKTSAGQPIGIATQHLCEVGAVDPNVNFFVRIDQYEELTRLEDWQSGAGASLDYGSVVHKMLGLRDPRVSYRIGTRRYAWNDQPRMQGTSGVIEELRNFKFVDLDDILSGREHRLSLFGDFAQDVLRRRLAWAGANLEGVDDPLAAVFGRTPTARDKARVYVRAGSFQPELPQGLAPVLRTAIIDEAAEDPLSGMLAEAWIRQKGPQDIPVDRTNFPWVKRDWWRKERTPLALLQIAARRRQRMIWYGKRDIIQLSGSSVLVFVSLCQSIWNVWLRTEEGRKGASSGITTFPVYVQDEGIQLASSFWFDKIRSDPGGDARQRFVRYVGELLRTTLRNDLTMSYPGHNGFSLDIDDLDSNQLVRSFLHNAASYGVLVDREHTTRNQSGGRRIKWYLASIYAPYFQIMVPHTKEPMYVRASTVEGWMDEARSSRSPAWSAGDVYVQTSLFDEA